MSFYINDYLREEAKELLDSDDLTNAPAGLEARLKKALKEDDLEQMRQLISIGRGLRDRDETVTEIWDEIV